MGHSFVFNKSDANAIIEWISSVDTEVAFWSDWFETKGLLWPEAYAKLTSGKIEFAYPEIVAGRDLLKVLDVGSGPISGLGNIVDGVSIELSACDPLAFAYRDMLIRAGINPYVVTDFALTEKLCDTYQKNSFDIVNMTNALDHAINPLLGVFNMLAVCKKGGLVVLHHRENEAEFEHYVGLHQWNISEDSGNLLFWNQTNRINVTSILGENAEVKVVRIGDGSQKLDTYIRAYITKKNECEFSVEGPNIYDHIFAQISLYAMSDKYKEIAANEGVIEKLRYIDKHKTRDRLIKKLKSVVRKRRGNAFVEKIVSLLQPIRAKYKI